MLMLICKHSVCMCMLVTRFPWIENGVNNHSPWKCCWACGRCLIWLHLFGGEKGITNHYSLLSSNNCLEFCSQDNQLNHKLVNKKLHAKHRLQYHIYLQRTVKISCRVITEWENNIHWHKASLTFIHCKIIFLAYIPCNV